MIQARFFITILLLLATLLPANADLLDNPEINGHLKSLDIGYAATPGTSLESGFFSANSQRLALQGLLADAVQLEFAIDNLLLYSEPPDQITLPENSPNRALDLEHNWNNGQHWSDQLSIDRLALKGNFNNFGWSIGRQAIGFGRIVIFSPLDVIAPFAPDALDSDIRPGVDALRGVHYFGLGGQIGGTVVFGNAKENNSYLLTFSDNRYHVDLLGLAGVLRDRELFGLGLAGNIGTLGVKIEASHYNGKDVGTPGGDLHDHFTVGALELWNRFDNGIIVLTQYLYNGAGADQPAGYPAAIASASVQEGLSFLLGQHYLLIGPSWEFHPLATLTGLFTWNLEDDSIQVRPQLEFSLADNLSLDFFYAFNFGAGPLFVTPVLSVPRSEFGSAGESGGLLLRWYF